VRVAALFSGGKDSAYAAMRAVESGHTLACLVTVLPPSPASELLHYPCAGMTALQAESMGVPHVLRRATTDGTGGQGRAVASALAEAAELHGAVGGWPAWTHAAVAIPGGTITQSAPDWGLTDRPIGPLRPLLPRRFGRLPPNAPP